MLIQQYQPAQTPFCASWRRWLFVERLLSHAHFRWKLERQETSKTMETCNCETEEHKRKLLHVCRIRDERFSKLGKGRAVPVVNFDKQSFLCCFCFDVSNDSAHIPPKYSCHRCVKVLCRWESPAKKKKIVKRIFSGGGCSDAVEWTKHH